MPGGRPTKYNKEFHPLLAEALASKGLTEEQIAGKIGVSLKTIANWKNEHEEFLHALKSGKEEPDDLVEKSLFERATGYRHKVEKPMTVSDGKDMGSHVEIVEYEEGLAPDVTAQIFWLKNRRPDRWRDKQEVEHTGGISVTLESLDESL